MSARQAVLCFLVGGLAPGSALRKSSKRAKLNRTEVQDPIAQCGIGMNSMAQVGEPGMVDFTYTWGAPGVGSPALQNTRTEDICFPGLRTYHTAGTTNLVGVGTDIVAFVTNPVFYAHSNMEAKEFNVDTNVKTILPCSEHTTFMPRTTPRGSVPLHSPRLYAETAQRVEDCPMWTHLSQMANRKAYIQDPYRAAEEIKQWGWRLVGYATDDGQGSSAAGPQVSHLFQNPDTLECAVTFMGTDNWRDWISNLAIRTTSFCGLTYEDERCGSARRCSVRKPRGSFTHWGFTDRLRKIVSTDEWARNILPHLPFCSKLYAMGHSAGGAQAELFTACVANSLQPGEFGYEEDHKYMGFIKQNPKQLPYL